jgi:Tfp pilus assembly protein FimV
LLDRAIVVAPSNSVTLIFSAELAIASGDRDRASDLLRLVIESPIDAEWEFEHRRDRELARSLLERIEE